MGIADIVDPARVVSPGGGIAGASKRVMGRLGYQTDAPELQTVDLDPQSKEMIEQGLSRAGRSTDEHAAEMNQGIVKSAQNLGGDQALSGQAMNRLGADASYGEAIRKAYSQQAGKSVSDLVKKNQMKAELRRADKLKQMSGLMLAKQRVATQNNEMLVNSYNQAEMARAQFVSQLFQIGGQATAMHFGNKRDARMEKAMTQNNRVGMTPPTPTSSYGDDYGSGGFGGGSGMGYAGEME